MALLAGLGTTANPAIFDNSADVFDVVDVGGPATVTWNGGNDVIKKGYGAADALTYSGGEGNDSLLSGQGDDVLSGDNGDDTLNGNGSDDQLYGGTGADTLYGDNETDENGTALPITPLGTASGNDEMYGGADDDTMNGGGGDDFMSGGSGGDVMEGDRTAEVAPDDVQSTSPGDDEMYGDRGDDSLSGGEGRDDMWGGKGADIFLFNDIVETGNNGSTADVIHDFDKKEDDVLDLSAIDANSNSGGNQNFDYIGSSNFSGNEGELRFFKGKLTGDTDGDGRKDFMIKLPGLDKMVEGDFDL